MRGPTAYETYLQRLADYYKIKRIDKPEWIDKASRYYSRLYYSARSFSEMCHDTAIPKATMEYLANLGEDSLDDLPKELISGGGDINSVLKDMYRELLSGKEEYFINEWTLSKAGRRKMREFVNRIPSASGIMPPKCEFTNVPKDISFSNRIYDFKAEYELTVTLAGSRICLRNGDGDSRHTEYIDFTERFLDEVIPMLQWENFENLLHEKDRSEGRDESIYQDFKTVLVDVNWNEFDLKLSPDNCDNVFMRLLRLVWEEYGEIMSEKGWVLPWFYTLGWTK